jgi:hypothetical protein
MTDLPLSAALAPARSAFRVAVSCPVWLQVALAWLAFLALRDWHWDTIGQVFGDTDDAMRLVEVRDLLGGQGWFDLVQHRLDPDVPVPSHWSRFVDLPIAALVRGFGVILPGASAEKLAMLAWPPLTFLPMLVALRLAACRLAEGAGGAAARMAGASALFLAVTCLTGTWQFFPGRIDHHNVQLALTAALLVVMLAPGDRWAPLLAGALCGMMLAVGFETLPYVMIAAACEAWRFATRTDGRAEVAGFGLSLAGTTTAFFLATIPVARYGVATCDALSISMLALAAGGGLALAAAALVAGDTPGRRVVALLAAAAAALGLFAWIEPACLHGPFGQIDPAIKPLWLDHVDEVQPITRVWAESRLRAAVAILDPLAALAFVPLLLRRSRQELRAPIVGVAASVAVSLAIGAIQIRTMVYANLLAVPVLAAAVAVLAERARRHGTSAPVAWVAGTLLASSTVLAMAASALPAFLAPGELERLATRASRATCYDTRLYAALAGEKPGRVLDFIDSGPFILATTPHQVMAAPYHRNSHGIVAAARALAATPGDAEALVREEGVDLLALCTHSSTLGRLRDESPWSLAVRLADGEVPGWLERIPTGTTALLAYRVKPAR